MSAILQDQAVVDHQGVYSSVDNLKNADKMAIVVVEHTSYDGLDNEVCEFVSNLYQVISTEVENHYNSKSPLCIYWHLSEEELEFLQKNEVKFDCASKFLTSGNERAVLLYL